MFKSSLVITFIQILVYLVSFSSQLVLARLFGASSQLDVYLLAISIPHLFISITSSTLSFSLVPELVKKKNVDGQFSELLTIFFWVFCIISILTTGLAILMTPAIAREFLPPRLPAYLRQQYVVMARLMWIAYGFSILTSFFTAVSNATRAFFVPALLTVFPYLGMLSMALVFGTKIGSVALTLGMLIGYVLSAPLLFLSIRRQFSFTREAWGLRGHVMKILHKTPIVLFSMFGISAYGVMDAIFVGRLGPNALSEFTYAQRLLVALSNVILLGPMTVLLPYLSEVHASDNDILFRYQTLRAMRILFYFIAFLVFSLAIFSFPLVRLLFERGAFTRETTKAVASIMPGLSLGVALMICTILLFRALYAKGDIFSTLIIGSLGAVSYFSLSFFLGRYMGINGILTAYALSWALQLTLAMSRIWKESPQDILCWGNLKFLIKLSASLIFAGIAVQLVSLWVDPVISDKFSPILRVLLSGCVAATVFGCLSILVFRMEEPLTFIHRFTGSYLGSTELSDEE